MAKKKPRLRPAPAAVSRERFQPDEADTSVGPLVSAQHCTLCDSDAGPFTVVFDGRRQLSICAECAGEDEQ